ncbi:MAG: hypothetical protein KAH95_16225, partial [Spirochaetales bacterium]|nr:hypothetical protein [Spirochaetales bacterium]
MKKAIVFLFTIVMLVLGSCTSITKISETNIKNPINETSQSGSNYKNITSPYTLESLLLPVLQMNNFMMSMDYFDQFLDYNDYIFPDYLFTLLAMETDSYQPGYGTVLKGDSGLDLPAYMFEKAFLSKTEDGNSWWRFHMQSSGDDLFLEILVNSYGIPEKVRFEDPDFGQKFEIIPDLAIDFERAESEVPPDKLAASVADKIDRSIEDGFLMIFINPVIIGEELINTPAGEFMSVLVKDFQSESTVTNYWLSPDVPGGIIRISITDSTDGESHVTELLQITNKTESYFSGEDIIPYSSYGGSDQGVNSLEPGYSEGS